MKQLHRFSFWMIRALTAPVLLLPYSALHKVGNALGIAAYFLMPNFRKRALSNLALATDLQLSESDIKRLAKESFQNLMITCLEYPKLAREQDIHRIAICENPEEADQIRREGKSIIFFCGHQANWELLFLEGTSRMPGVAIGRPVKNGLLYDWVLSIRQKYGGKIVPPKQAVKEGLRGLKQGAFLGIVGDQGMPDSGYSSPFFGRTAWTSPLPALLSYKTGSPIIVATTLRKEGRYIIHYSEPIWPNEKEPLDQEVDRMMRQALKFLEDKIKEAPGQWLWQHNRWKQQTPERLKRRYRHESLGLIFPEDRKTLEGCVALLPTLRAIYPHEFFTLIIPAQYRNEKFPDDMKTIFYHSQNELFVRDYSLKLIFNFTPLNKVRSHFLSLGAFEVVSLKDIEKCAEENNLSDLSSALRTLLLRK